MTILYKLTDQLGRTRAGYSNETQWGEGVTHRAADGLRDLCTNTVIHAYVSPELAMLLNPAHADINDPLLWEADGEIVVRDDVKVGVVELTTRRTIPALTATTTQIVAFAILCAKAVYSEATFLAWADGWLSGEDRSAQAAAAIEATARPAAVAARTMTAEAAAAAALAAAEAAACEADPALEADMARLAALAATMAGPAIDLPAIAKQALVSDWSGK